MLGMKLMNCQWRDSDQAWEENLNTHDPSDNKLADQAIMTTVTCVSLRQQVLNFEWKLELERTEWQKVQKVIKSDQKVSFHTFKLFSISKTILNETCFNSWMMPCHRSIRTGVLLGYHATMCRTHAEVHVLVASDYALSWLEGSTSWYSDTKDNVGDFTSMSKFIMMNAQTSCPSAHHEGELLWNFHHPFWTRTLNLSRSQSLKTQLTTSRLEDRVTVNDWFPS
jgi:hypothetical protein